MTLSDLPLHDIVDDYAAGWWPLAWGWWVLIIICLALIATALTLLYKHHRRRKPKRLALSILNEPAASISELNLRLKQAALLYYSREQIAELHGENWHKFLITALPEKSRNEFAQALTEYQSLQYQPHGETEINAYKILLERWVILAWPPQPQRESTDV